VSETIIGDEEVTTFALIEFAIGMFTDEGTIIGDGGSLGGTSIFFLPESHPVIPSIDMQNSIVTVRLYFFIIFILLSTKFIIQKSDLYDKKKSEFGTINSE